MYSIFIVFYDDSVWTLENADASWLPALPLIL